MNNFPALGTTYQGLLGAVIHTLRAESEKNITQTDIAKQLGITVSTWSRIERGESSLTLEQLVAVAAYFELPLSTLFKFVEEKIEELERQGVTVAISKEALMQSNIMQLSTAQILSILPGGVVGLLGAAVYGIYKTLLKASKK
jgi:transcriptional regulator with XRE-family HTH domain